MFVLNSNITIGDYKNIKPHEIKITKTVHSFVDTAFIKLPTRAAVKSLSDIIVETAKQFKPGDFVQIDLGYNGELKNEFTGFVSKVNFTTPCEIECEGYSFQLRKKQYTPKHFRNVRMLDVLNYIIAGTSITIDKKHLQDLACSLFLIHVDENGIQVLENLKKYYSNSIQFYFKNNVLYAEPFPVIPFSESAHYQLGWNVIKDEGLKLEENENTNTKIIYSGTAQDGTIITGSYKNKKSYSGNRQINEEVKIIKTGVTDKKTQEVLAKSTAISNQYKNYRGKLKAFLVPYCEPAWKAEITDKKNPDRDGTYLVSGTEVIYGMGGARRTLDIALKLKDRVKKSL